MFLYMYTTHIILLETDNVKNESIQNAYLIILPNHNVWHSMASYVQDDFKEGLTTRFGWDLRKLSEICFVYSLLTVALNSMYIKYLLLVYLKL